MWNWRTKSAKTNNTYTKQTLNRIALWLYHIAVENIRFENGTLQATIIQCSLRFKSILSCLTWDEYWMYWIPNQSASLFFFPITLFIKFLEFIFQQWIETLFCHLFGLKIVRELRFSSSKHFLCFNSNKPINFVAEINLKCVFFFKASNVH